MSGGAVRAACDAVRTVVARRLGRASVMLSGGKVLADNTEVIADLIEVLAEGVIEETAVFRHRPTAPLDPTAGQGNSHVQLALCVHRAVVDVDVELGLVKVVELAAVQDVG